MIGPRSSSKSLTPNLCPERLMPRLFLPTQNLEAESQKQWSLWIASPAHGRRFCSLQGIRRRQTCPPVTRISRLFDSLDDDWLAPDGSCGRDGARTPEPALVTATRLAYDPCALFWGRGAATPQRPRALGLTLPLITRTWRCLESELKA